MERWAGVTAIVGGIGWAIAAPLVASAAVHEPVGIGYDDYNRLLTLPLAFLAVALAGLRRLQLPELSPWGRRGAATAIAGAALLVLGNVIEFWAVLLSDDAVYAIARDRGLEEWAGSTTGWLTFLTGAALLLAGGIVFGVSSARTPILPGWAGLVLAATAPLMLAAIGVWAESVLLTAVFAGALGLAWVVLGSLLLAAIELRQRTP